MLEHSNIICQTLIVMFIAVLHCMNTQSVCAVNIADTVNSIMPVLSVCYVKLWCLHIGVGHYPMTSHN